MFIFRHGGRRATQLVAAAPTIQLRTASRLEIPNPQAGMRVIGSCPAPTCSCRETPPGLEIEREADLNGTMAKYGEQVLISTGREDWKSRIEDDDDALLTRKLRRLLLRGGKFADPYHNVLLTHSSLQPEGADEDLRRSPSPSAALASASAFLLPSFRYVPSIPTDDSSVESFVRAFILPPRARELELQRGFAGSRPVDEILVLVCGHGGRDERCGALAPVLGAEFRDKLRRRNVAVLGDELGDRPKARRTEGNAEAEAEYAPTARVASISHIGGHKWAGNVVVYIPPAFTSNPLAGTGIWYGRVEPLHVEGIVEHTILQGTIIRDLFRGGVDSSRQVLRL